MKLTWRRLLTVTSIVMIVTSFGFPAEAKQVRKSSVKQPKGKVTTWLGRLNPGENIDANTAYLDLPAGFTADSACNLFVADTQDNVIRKIDGATNFITTFAGTGEYELTDGAATTVADFRAPYDAEIGPNGELYALDYGNKRIRIVKNGVVSSWLKNLKNATGTALDGTTLYIGDTGNNRILKATIPDGAASVVANILSPGKLAVLNGMLYVANSSNTTVSRVDISSGAISTVKGGLTDVDGITVYNGKVYFVASDKGMYNEVWQYDPATGESVRLIRVVETEWYNHASDILFCKDMMYLLFSVGSSIFRLNPDATNPVKIAGKHRYGDDDGSFREAVLGRPKSLVFSNDRKKLYILENHRIKVFDMKTKQLSFIAGSPMDNWRDDVGNSARMSGPTQMVLSKDGKKLYFADRNNNRIRALVIDEARLETLTGAGNINQFGDTNNGYAEGAACADEFDLGVAGCAYFNRPMGIAISKDGTTLYVTDYDNNRIRSVDISTGATKLIAGSGVPGLKDGVGGTARLRGPISLALSDDGKKLYVVELGNHALREVDLRTNRVRTLIGKGKAGYREGKFKDARLSYPDSVADGRGNTLFLSEVGSQRIRKIDLAKKTTTLIAGSGLRGNTNGPRLKASFNGPRGMVQLNANYLLVADKGNDLIRAIDLR
ncbi:MAG: hypothetical protein HY420_00570 [Candidatus Kerfeldbacteria bacterium]|nr:hypothetical protein [Candidatus Kerfeldbacteria bacterium]